MKRILVYMLKCADGSYYVGNTTVLDVRVAQHNEGIDPNAYTYSRRPVQLVWSQGFASPYDANGAERQIKGWSRAKKEALIHGDWDLIHEIVKSERKRREKKRK